MKYLTIVLVLFFTESIVARQLDVDPCLVYGSNAVWNQIKEEGLDNSSNNTVFLLDQDVYVLNPLKQFAYYGYDADDHNSVFYKVHLSCISESDMKVLKIVPITPEDLIDRAYHERKINIEQDD